MPSVHSSIAAQSRKSPSTTPAKRATERSRSDSRDGLYRPPKDLKSFALTWVSRGPMRVGS